MSADLEHPVLVTATAAEQPCSLYEYHAPRVVRTQYHHSKPAYLQRRLWGEERFGPDTWLCGSCHDAVHEWIGFLLGESRHPDPEPGRFAKELAEATVEWFRAEQAPAGS